MNPEQYATQQAVISAAVAAYVSQFLKLFAQPALGIAQWLQLLELLYPEVQRQRKAASELARRFYDSQRTRHYPGRHDVLLEEFPIQWFVESMEPYRKGLSKSQSNQNDLGNFTRGVVKEVENGGRRTMIHAVESDSAPVRGWARVATGRETCAWCLMLISRGPVYMDASTAGLDLDSFSAQRMVAAGEDVSEYMTQWHAGCDCKVVPVFDRRNWTGKAAADEALELWKEATLEAQRFRDAHPGRKHTSGKRAGEEFTLNEDAILALRRRLEAGEIDPGDWSGLSIAA